MRGTPSACACLRVRSSVLKASSFLREKLFYLRHFHYLVRGAGDERNENSPCDQSICGAMACTSISFARVEKPLHTQVTNLREERVTLLETVRALREDKDTLTKQLAKASEKITELQKQLGESDAARALAVSEKDHALRESSKSGALASQLRIEATGWQARCEQGEAERARSAAEWDINSRRNQDMLNRNVSG